MRFVIVVSCLLGCPGCSLGYTCSYYGELPFVNVRKLIEKLSVLLLYKLKLTVHWVSGVKRLNVIGFASKILVINVVESSHSRGASLAVCDLYNLFEETLVLLVDLVLLSWISKAITLTLLRSCVQRWKPKSTVDRCMLLVARREDLAPWAILPLARSLLGRKIKSRWWLCRACFLRWEQLLWGGYSVDLRHVKVIRIDDLVKSWVNSSCCLKACKKRARVSWVFGGCHR